MSSRMVLLLSIVTLIGLTFFAAACQTSAGESAQVTTDNPLVGVWVQSSSGPDFYWQFTADGTYSISTLYEDLEKFSAMSGTFTYEDSVLTLNATPDPPNRQYCSGETARYTVKFDQAEGFILEDLDSECFRFTILSGENSSWKPHNQ